MKKAKGLCLFLAAVALFTVLPVAAADRDPVRRYLILGCDEAAGLTDAILLVARNSESGEVRILQIPRDTAAVYSGGKSRKINGAFRSLGGRELAAFFSRALGVKIHRYAAIDLPCLALLVDQVGGVDLEVPIPMDYSDPEQGLEIHLPAGRQHLNGAAAQSFVRFRSGYANADLGRMDAQKVFLRAFAEKLETLDSGALLRLFFAAAPHTKTDLPVQEAVALANGLRGADLSGAPMERAPGEAVKSADGAWFFVVSREGLRTAVNRLLMPQIPVSDGAFDPDRVFDRPAEGAFHRIYSSPAEGGKKGYTE